MAYHTSTVHSTSCCTFIDVDLEFSYLHSMCISETLTNELLHNYIYMYIVLWDYIVSNHQYAVCGTPPIKLYTLP